MKCSPIPPLTERGYPAIAERIAGDDEENTGSRHPPGHCRQE
ncbi:MAG TPA: hypothetical protein PKG69_02155 [Methanoregulaceae archaeon]|nr:hypothetical protein [Methanoregulaceae archaeon]